MVEHEDGSINITVAGLNKRAAVPFICDGWAYSLSNRKELTSPFERFTEGLYVPSDYTGKNTHTYIDTERQGVLTDYLGNTAEYHELSAVHLEPTEYSLSLSKDFIEYLLNMREIET